MALDGMMQFRLSYLQLVAWAWEKEARYDELVDPQNPRDRWAYFDDLGLERPKWTIQLKIADPKTELPGSGFAPAETGGWIGPRAHLTFQFPAPPADVDIPAAAAAYYARLPNPFGEPQPVMGLAAVSSGAGGQGMGHASDAFVLGGVIVRALTVSWSNSDFRTKLTSGASINGLLMDYLGYNLPWNMDLFGTAGTSTYVPVKDKVGTWKDPLLNTLEMFMPRRPAGSGADRALALAAYNQTGDQYPLTCP